MLSMHLIDRLFRSGQYDKMLQGLSDNGMDLPLPLRVRLSQSPVSALALGLRRVVDLTYGPTPLSEQMVAGLLEAQDESGSFQGDPLATALAAGALTRLIHEHESLAGHDDGSVVDPHLPVARDRALAALAGMQDGDGLFAFRNDRTWQDRALVGAFICWQLGGDDAFRAAVRFVDLLDWFEQHGDALERQTHQVWCLARAETGAAAAPPVAA